MGGSGPSQWRRWHPLGGKVLLACSRPAAFSEDRLVFVALKDSVAGSDARAFGASALGSVQKYFSSSISKSNCAKHSSGAEILCSWQQSVHFLPGKGFSADKAVCCSREAASAFSTTPCRGRSSTVGRGNWDTVGSSRASHSHSWLHRSGFPAGQNSRSMSTMSTTIGTEQPSTGSVDQNSPYPMFPSHSFVTPPKSFRRTGGAGSIVNGILDSSVDVSLVSRVAKLPLQSALPSLRNHRMGDASLMGMQGLEAAAPMPAGDLVDWQQQRLGRLKEYDAPARSQPSSPHSDAEPDDIFIPVKAFYISRSVDLKSLAREPFLEVTSSRNNLIIRCADRPPHSPVTADNPEMACLGFLKERYMVTFQYGSVVFFNFGDLEEVESLDVVRKYCSDEFREARKDDYGVLVRPTLAEWSEGGHDRVMLRKLDIDNIRVISSILGQSIALDHYAKKVDEMVTTFSELNRGMEQTGTFTMTRKSLFQLVAAANTTLADVILRLGLLERSDAAWKDANYAQIWEYLRDDFELDERFESLDFKLNIIQHNVRFFLEILQNRKSDTLEWIIILLITGEICVSLYDILHTAGAF